MVVYTAVPCTGPCTRPPHGRVHGLHTAVYTVVYKAADTISVHSCVHGLYTVVYTVVYTCTQPVRAVSTAVYGPCTLRTTPYIRLVHGRVYGRVHGRVHGPYTAVYSAGRVYGTYTAAVTYTVRVHDPYTVVYTVHGCVHGPFPRPRAGRVHMYTTVYGPYTQLCKSNFCLLFACNEVNEKYFTFTCNEVKF